LSVLSLLLRGIKHLSLVAMWHSVVHQVHRWICRVRSARIRPVGPPATSDYRRPGRVTGHARQGQTVTITCANGLYALTVLAPDLIRVHLHPATSTQYPMPNAQYPISNAQPPTSTSYSIAKPDDDWLPCDFHAVETEVAIEVRTSRLVCRVDRASGRVAFLDLDGNVVNEDEAGAGRCSFGYGRSVRAQDKPFGHGRSVRTRDMPAGHVICHKRIQPDEHFYGLGERTFGLDRRGRRYSMWHADPQTYQLDQDPIHLCMPVLLGLHSGGRQGYGLFFDNTFRGHFDLEATDPDVVSFGAEGGELCYYFIYGPALTTVVERYTELTGRMVLPPLWVLGYHQSRWSYYPQARVRKLAADFRDVYHVPCDCIHLDIHYMDGYRCFTWDSERFPDPASLMADLHQQGFKVIAIIDAGIKADRRYWVCKDGLEKDVFCKCPDGETLFKGPVWPGNCYFPDFTDPRVRTWWGDLYEALTDVGVDGVWNDMNEPAVFGPLGTTLPDSVRHDLEGRGGEHVEAHNVYGMQMARATVEGLMRLRPDERPVCITRSGWAGVQRYAMSWTGDNESNWSSLWLTMPMVMNLGLCGLANTGPDIGGFSGCATGELFTRWLQMGVFLPFFRTHTEYASPDQEPWSWGEPYLGVNRRFIELRYRLLPYLYTAFWQCARSGLPIVRPLLLAFQDDAATHTLDDQFLCGDAFLVAPVIEEGATRRSVYLPAGAWYDFWTDELLTGPAHVEVEAPLERLPLFVRAGAVVPMGPAMDHVRQRPAAPPTLHIYPGGGISWLYEDDGESLAYRQGEYRITRFTLAASAARLDLAREVEGPFDPGYGRLPVVVHGVEGPPEAVEGLPGAQVAYDARARTLQVSGGLFGDLRVRW
jgi:alpha-glucosidase